MVSKGFEYYTIASEIFIKKFKKILFWEYTVSKDIDLKNKIIMQYIKKVPKLINNNIIEDIETNHQTCLAATVVMAVVKAAVNKAHIVIPHSIQKTLRRRPSTDFGTLSP